jgi:hypothetical protein
VMTRSGTAGPTATINATIAMTASISDRATITEHTPTFRDQ